MRSLLYNPTVSVWIGSSLPIYYMALSRVGKHENKKTPHSLVVIFLMVQSHIISVGDIH